MIRRLIGIRSISSKPFDIMVKCVYFAIIKNLLASHKNFNMWNGFWELIWKLTMSSCGRYLFFCCWCCCLYRCRCWFSISFINWVFGLRVHWKKKPLIYTLFLRTHLSDFMEWVSSQQRQWEKPRQTGLRIEFTSGILHFSLSHSLTLFA